MKCQRCYSDFSTHLLEYLQLYKTGDVIAFMDFYIYIYEAHHSPHLFSGNFGVYLVCMVLVFQTVLKNRPVCLDGSQLACSLAALPTEQVILRETWLKRVRAHQQFKHRRGVWRAKRLQDESAYIVFAGDLTADGHCVIQQCVVKSSTLTGISSSSLSVLSLMHQQLNNTGCPLTIQDSKDGEHQICDHRERMFVINYNDNFIKVYKAVMSRRNDSVVIFVCVCVFGIAVKAKGQTVESWMV